jgi:hypothetical protein
MDHRHRGLEGGRGDDLTDDNFAMIVKAVGWSRSLRQLRKRVRFQMGVLFGLVVTFGAPRFNVVGGVAFVLRRRCGSTSRPGLQAITGYGEPAETLMKRKPRNPEQALSCQPANDAVARLHRTRDGRDDRRDCVGDHHYDTTVARTIRLTSFVLANLFYRSAARRVAVAFARRPPGPDVLVLLRASLIAIFLPAASTC